MENFTYKRKHARTRKMSWNFLFQKLITQIKKISSYTAHIKFSLGWGLSEKDQ